MARRCVWFVLVMLVVSPSCGEPEDDHPSRLGELGRVKFTGGGGCNDSTTLALGATAEMGLEPQKGTLPEGLRVRSTVAEVLGAERGDADDRIVLTGNEVGSARVELHDGDELYDWLGFAVEEARSVKHSAPERVVEGATFLFEIEEIFGECGEECPLIGTDFLDWQARPEQSLSFLDDVRRVASFRAGTPGTVTITGLDRRTDHEVVRHGVEVIAQAEVQGLDATVLVMPPDDQEAYEDAFPAAMPVESRFVIEVVATTDGEPIPIAGADLRWDLSEAGTGITTAAGDPLGAGPLFEANAAGESTLTVHFELLSLSRAFTVRVDDP